ncbi:alpha-ketoglutarate transporter [Salmonella bongori]|nr:alpha-ketoglutarate transporter [Salmonella bongori]
MFPAQVRALGVGLSYAVANALFGGSAEYVALVAKICRYGELVLLVCNRDGYPGLPGFTDVAS